MKRYIQYGLKSVMIAIDLIRYLSLRVQQVLLGENQTMCINNISLSQSRIERSVSDFRSILIVCRHFIIFLEIKIYSNVIH
jgi:hypothetical protein